MGYLKQKGFTKINREVGFKRTSSPMNQILLNLSNRIPIFHFIYNLVIQNWFSNFRNIAVYTAIS